VWRGKKFVQEPKRDGKVEEAEVRKPSRPFSGRFKSRAGRVSGPFEATPSM